MKPVACEIKPAGHYSPAIVSGSRVYVAGQPSVDPATGKTAEGGIRGEVLMALSRMETILKSAGCTRENVVVCRIYVTSMQHWGVVNAAFAEFFGEHRPARIVLPVGDLGGFNVELEAEAELPGTPAAL